MTELTIQLLPCPFCGGEAQWLGIHDGHSIVCAKTCVGSGRPAWTEEEAVKAWNTRVNPSEYLVGEIKE